MLRFLCFAVLFTIFLGYPSEAQERAGGAAAEWVESMYRESADRLIDAALADSALFDRLAYLCDTFGPRFSGTQNLEDAIDWILAEMEQDGLENVRGEEVMVPRWIRGNEHVRLIEPRVTNLPMLGLGGSIATPAEGITAEVLVVRSFEELEERAGEAAGKIVLFNAPFTTYGPTVQYRVRGAIEAAKAGAVGVIIRSVAPFSMQTPHTGGMRYEEGVPQIPAAAITLEDADMLDRFQQRGQRVVVNLYMEAHFLPDVPSRNVIAEVVGSEIPEEVVVIGGHIDSWDVGQGAMDDAGGCVAAWEAARLLLELGLRPRRTVRVVLWTNEENGLRGALAYRDNYEDQLDNHVMAIESDAGVFRPRGLGFGGTREALLKLREIAPLLSRIGADEVFEGGGGADIGPLMRRGVPGAGLVVEGNRYFWYHHTEADNVYMIDPHELNLCAATLAVWAYVLADMPERLPRSTAGEGRMQSDE